MVRFFESATVISRSFALLTAKDCAFSKNEPGNAVNKLAMDCLAEIEVE